jgi:erythrocyte band 7 integral membrane protein
VDTPAQLIHTTQAGLLQKFGKFVSILDAGLNYINPITEKVVRVDLRTRILDPQKQAVITKDNVTMSVDSSVYYRVINAKICAYKIGAEPGIIDNAVLEMCHAALRTICGEHTFQQLLEERENIARRILECVESQISIWGIYVEHVFLKDLHLPK